MSGSQSATTCVPLDLANQNDVLPKIKLSCGPHHEDLPLGHVQSQDLHAAGRGLLLLLQGHGRALGQVGVVGQPGAREAVGGQVVQQVQ
jgi:hypothetical protein